MGAASSLGELDAGLSMPCASATAPQQWLRVVLRRCHGFDLLRCHGSSQSALFLCRYAASYVFVEQLGGWRWMYGLAAAPAALLLAGEPCTGV